MTQLARMRKQSGARSRSGTPPAGQRACKQWQESKTCSYGDACKFSHGEKAAPAPKAEAKAKAKGKSKAKAKAKAEAAS